MSQQSWAQFLTELDKFVAIHGHARVPQNTTTQTATGQEYRLGRRVNRIRTGRDQLTQDQVDQLQARPGWAWDSRRAQWEQRAADLATHVATTGSLTGLPASSRQWVLRQRWAAREGDLTSAQIRTLKQIPGVLDSPNALEAFLTAAAQWLEQHPTKSMSDLTTKDQVQHHGELVPLLKRATYWRRRRDGREGTHALPEEDAHRLEQLRGWSWEGPRTRN